MDNITHSLIGAAVGQVFLRSENQKKAHPRQASWVLWTAILASNIPDLDFVLIRIFESGNLGYLLHHRGWSHTVLASLPIGFLSMLVGKKLAKIPSLEKTQTLRVTCIGILCALLHIFGDFWNNYGVHPFTPLWNGWIYGDFIFIIEPLIWFSLIPFLWFRAKNKKVRWLLTSFLLAITGLLSLRKFNTGFVLTWDLAWLAVMVFLQKQIRSVCLALSALAVILILFQTGSQKAKTELSRFLQSEGREEDILNLSVTPLPSNPFCWTIYSSSKTPSEYVARAGTLSLQPSLFKPAQCLTPFSQNGMTPLRPAESANNEIIIWHGEFRSPIEQLENFQKKSCRFDAFLRFSRIPVWFPYQGQWMAADLRYDHEKGPGFSKIPFSLSGSEACPRSIPNWIPPTAH